MNYTTTLVLAAFLLAQLVSCSGGGYKVVCKTSHSYVLRQFNRTATLFQENLHEAARCLNNSNENLDNCLNASNILTPYSTIIIAPKFPYKAPFSIKDVNEMHQTACNILNNHAKNHGFVKDIPLKEYNVITNSESIKAILESISIGVKFKTNKSEVLKMVKHSYEMMKTHYQSIKTCISDGDVFKQNAFSECIKKVDDNLFYDLDPLMNEVALMGGPRGIDDVALKILLNHCLNRKANSTFDNTNYHCDMYERTFELSDRSTSLFWIKFGAGVFAVAVLAGIIAYFFKKKSDVVVEDDEEKAADSESQE